MTKYYSYQEAFEECLEYFSGDELAANVIVTKYLLTDDQGRFLEKSPDQMLRRIAKELHRVELKYPNPLSEEEIFSLLQGFKQTVLQGSPMSGIGNDARVQSLSNCFVIPAPEDSYGGILKTDQELVQIAKRRGGVGFDLSTIRPKGLTTANAARTTDGIEVFMDRFSNSCREVAQGGRRGALMLTISCHHPQIRDFIKIKRNLTRVTGANISIRFTDEFMNAVVNNEQVELRWPVDSKTPQISMMDSASEIWHEAIENAHAAAEPGAIFWDTATSMTPSDIYTDEGFGSQSTNPCLTSDVEIAVADGRGYATIGELAAAGVDVPVYAYDSETDKVVVKTMRNPRLTGKNMPVYKVNIEGGHSFRATGNHSMVLRDGTTKTVQDLQNGDQLMISKRVERNLVEINPKIRTKNKNNYVMIENYKGSRSEHRMIWEHHNGKIPSGHVIHHVNFSPKDNRLTNLACMHHKDHQELHASTMRGENNPIFKIKADPIRFAEYSKKMSKSIGGLNNPRAHDISNEDILKHIEMLTTSLGRRPSNGDWVRYAEENSLPKFLNSFRLDGKKFSQITSEISEKLGLPNELISIDPRMATRALEAQDSGYSWRVMNNELQVERECEWCGDNFWNSYDRREISFCGYSCSNYYANRKNGKNVSRAATLRKMHMERGTKNRIAQLNTYTQLRFELGREPLQKEWASACKDNKHPARLGTDYGFKTWNELKTEASLHNHRVISVEFDGYEDVYNGTVDDVHNFYFGGWDSGNNERIQLLSLNCGEIILSPFDSCRLALVNLTAFVDDPYTDISRFNFEKFSDVAHKSQRLMDDMIDLEIEQINKILTKIESDPESEEVKRIEKNLWTNIKQAALRGRRTGLGITGLGDTLASLGLTYGSSESIETVESIYKTLALSAHKSSCLLAKERGAFEVFSYDKEAGHKYMERLYNADPELRELAKQHGRRNIAITTTAPAGSVSVLTQTTSGIEPAFMLHYTRRKKLTGQDEKSRVDFVDASGDKWQEYVVYHHGFKKWLDIVRSQGVEAETLEDFVALSPYKGSTANEIDWVSKVDLQAAAQRWVDHAISNTNNLPGDVDVETVKRVYTRAWETGCKGVTIYRDGSRSGVLVSSDDKKNEKKEGTEIVYRSAPKRPLELECDIHQVRIKNEAWTILVGKLDGKPYEVMGGLSELVEIPRKYKGGTLKKRSSKSLKPVYDLVINTGDNDELLVKDVVNVFDNPNYSAFTRTISLTLRHGVPVNYLVEQLQKDKNADLFSFSKVIARCLKNYIEDGTKAGSGIFGEKCCDNPNIVYQEGCATCSSCGTSKCS